MATSPGARVGPPAISIVKLRERCSYTSRRIDLCCDWASIHKTYIHVATQGGPPIRSATPSIWRDALIGQPQSFGRRAALPEHVDGNAASRIPVPADPEPLGRQEIDQALAHRHRAVLVKSAMVAERAQIQLERLGFHEPVAGDVV